MSKEKTSLDFIMAFEGGECESDEEVIEGFQMLLDEGLAFKLQGSYGRMAHELLRQGLIAPKSGQVVRDYFGNVVAKG